ncbi:hypothetical protein, partial [Pseudomonas aeruginosa]|uniref:hypothetical protein n=1 Tax=Pseudomonas aeruginosa TaxID=287 RepID=UPI001C52D33A
DCSRRGLSFCWCESLHFLRSSTPFPAGQIFSTPLNAKSPKTAGLELAAGGEPTVRSLVERWALVEGLEDFAAAVKAAMMPA